VQIKSLHIHKFKSKCRHLFKDFSTNIVTLFFTAITANVLQLGEVAEIEAQMFSFAQKFNRRTELEFSTEPAILPNCCWWLFYS
jgi:hypothetical protein